MDSFYWINIFKLISNYLNISYLYMYFISKVCIIYLIISCQTLIQMINGINAGYYYFEYSKIHLHNQKI